MEFFISGQIKEAGTIKAMMIRVQEAGHSITHDWTATDGFLGSREAKLANVEEAGRRARADILGVVACNVYVLDSNNEFAGKGMNAELGAALAMHEVNGSPDIYIVGERNHLSVFYLHPAVVHVDTIDDVLAHYPTPEESDASR